LARGACEDTFVGERNMDITSISAAMSSLKAATDIVQGMIKLKSAVDVQTKLIELQSQILAAQSNALHAQAEYSALLEKVESLQKELARLKAWEQERTKYVLKEVSQGNFAYVLKDGTNAEEPEHWLCCQCFNDGYKSVVQFSGHKEFHKVFLCNKCKSTLHVRIESAGVTIETIPRRDRWSDF